MNNLDAQYLGLLDDILKNGREKKDRTGTGTLSVFGRTIRHNMNEGFPLLTTKKVAFKAMTVELCWFLKGYFTIDYLLEHNCLIWIGDLYKKYLKTYPLQGFKGEPLGKLEFLEKLKTDKDFLSLHGSLGPIYGEQWRNWSDLYSLAGIDQIQNLVNNLKNNPEDRGLIVSAWNVAELPYMALRPCHYLFQCYTDELTLFEREVEAYKLYDKVLPVVTHEAFDKINIPKYRLSLKWNQRSVDTFLGLPFNIASYGLLLNLLAAECNMIPNELIGDLGDTHLYLNHLDAAKTQLSRQNIYKLPTVKIRSTDAQPVFSTLEPSDFTIVDYKCHPAIQAPLSN